MKYAVKIIKAILVIMLTLVVTGIVTIKIFSSTILDEGYVFRMLQKSNYYSKIHEIVKSSFENYIGPSGLDENILGDICTVEDIQKDTETILGNIYEGTDKKVNTDAIKQRVIKKIDTVLEQETNASQENINKFAEAIGEEYINTISHTDYEESLNDALKKVTKITDVGQKALFISLVVILVLLVVLNIKTLYLAICNIGIAGLSSGAFLVVTNLIVNNRVKVQQIKILNDPISTVLQNIVTDILNQVIRYGWIIVAVGAVCIIVGNIIKVKNTEE